MFWMKMKCSIHIFLPYQKIDDEMSCERNEQTMPFPFPFSKLTVSFFFPNE